MKNKDKNLLKSEPIAKLETTLQATLKKLVEIRLDHKMQKLSQTSQIGKLKNEIAVLKTIIHQKQKEIKIKKEATK